MNLGKNGWLKKIGDTLEKTEFRINKIAFPYRFEVYIFQTLIFLFFGYIFIFENLFFWVIFCLIYNILHFLITSHSWNFYSDRIDVKFTFRKKSIIFPIGTFKLHASSGSGNIPQSFKIILKPNHPKSFRLILPYWMYYANPDQSEINQIIEFSKKHKIELSGDWE